LSASIADRLGMQRYTKLRHVQAVEKDPHCQSELKAHTSAPNHLYSDVESFWLDKVCLVIVSSVFAGIATPGMCQYYRSPWMGSMCQLGAPSSPPRSHLLPRAPGGTTMYRP
jgi:hypothetical protein